MTTQGYKSSNSTELSYREALRQAMIEEMDRDPDVFMLGQDIGIEGGMWEVTKGLLEKYGPDRVLDTPISESAILGAVMGFIMSFLMNYFLIPFPPDTFMNGVNNGISGLLSGFMGGFMGMFMYFRMSGK